ncbi:hypothetical protein BCR33DRAFT_720655 [Rhizoclosmatium globosum]|uniref:Uncharacterized protein n=1 Tax=Rhizoclosmatium globosum TaxID=329046 RepID=A0A1Y2BX08_9FUNG|nr:hypothetical protein BCR33DRAFT_720655 [Rhizoclosmatium globosum]|eukprot:ORY38645.1 hypothetical protein BCR33DRAFT_720655 [Rhizoclosmatium globosum]
MASFNLPFFPIFKSSSVANSGLNQQNSSTDLNAADSTTTQAQKFSSLDRATSSFSLTQGTAVNGWPLNSPAPLQQQESTSHLQALGQDVWNLAKAAFYWKP